MGPDTFNPLTSALTLGVADAVNPLVRDLVLVLAASAAVAVALQRLRLAAVSAYLLAGAVLGPDALGLIDSPDRLNAITDLAIILLMFTIGLQIDLGLMRRDLRLTLLVGIGSVGATWIVGWPIAMAFGLGAPAALAVAMALSLSSTAIVLRSLAERRELRQPHGRIAFGVLVTQDMAVLVALVLVPLLASWQLGTGDPNASDLTSGALVELALRGIWSIAGVTVLIAMARFALPRVLGIAAEGGARELTLIVATAAAVGAGLATRWLGFSPELGAFLAGLVLASTPFRHQISGQIGPLRDVFIAVFFTVLGMRIDPEGVLAQWWVILLGGLVMSIVKACIITSATRLAGATLAVSALVGLSLAQAGEFSLVILSEAEEQQLLSEDAVATCVAITVVSLILTPMFIAAAHRVATHLTPRASEGEKVRAVETSTANDHVIIAGFGPVGRAVAERLEHASVPYTVIEMNARTVQIESSLGRSIVYGDAANPDILEAAGAHDAAAIVLTMPDETASFAAIQLVRAMNPDIFVVTRTLVVSKAMLARGLGADEAVSDELAAADAMQRAVRRRLIEERLRRGEPTDHKT